MPQYTVPVFSDPFAPRMEDSKWHVIQSSTLLKLAEDNGRSRSLITYAAFEMRQAIEQEMFTIVRLVSRAQNESALLERCRKKDGLFKELLSAEPNYTNRCYLMSVIASEFPIFPKVANWDIKRLKQLWLKLSGYCHSPQTLDKQLNDDWYKRAHIAIVDAHHYMFQ